MPKYICKSVLNHIAPHFVRNENLIKLVFGSLYNAGYSGENYYYTETEIIPVCIACFFVQDYPPAIPVILKAMANNKHMIDIRIGELLIKANKYIDGIENQWSSINEYHISDQVKESLLGFIELIKNNEDRAEIMLSLMAR